jgi:hypothetical protein
MELISLSLSLTHGQTGRKTGLFKRESSVFPGQTVEHKLSFYLPSRVKNIEPGKGVEKKNKKKRQ